MKPADVPRMSWPGQLVFHGIVLSVMGAAITFRQGHPAYPGFPLLTFAVTAWLPLLFRRRWPLGVLICVVAVESSHLVLISRLDPTAANVVWAAAYQPVPVATMAAVTSYAALRPQRNGWLAGGVSAAVLLIISWLTQPSRLAATDFVMVDLVLIAAIVGVAVTGRREVLRRCSREAQEAAGRLVVTERLRIARDLHDVLAHRLTLVNAQAGVADCCVSTTTTHPARVDAPHCPGARAGHTAMGTGPAHADH